MGLEFSYFAELKVKQTLIFFFPCTYVGIVWKQIGSKLDPSSNPNEDFSLKHKIKNWWRNDRVSTHEALPVLFVFTI